jgi:M6 family metalloprotease-like protein
MNTLFAICALLSGDYIDHFADPDDIGLMKIPREGATTVLVVPVFVEDQPFQRGSETTFQGEIDSFYDPNSSEPFNFSDYWSTLSLTRWTPTAVVADPVRFPTCPPLGEYEDCAIPRGAGVSEGDFGGAAQTLGDALRFLDEIMRCATSGPGNGLSCTGGGGVNLADFDNSGIAGSPDGFVDGVIVVSNARFPGIALPVKDLSSNALLAQLAGPLPSFEYDGITVGATAIAGFQSAPQRTTWVAVHELGHLLGFADLYNESGTTNDMPYTLMGGWFYSDPASLLDAYSRMAIGWAHVIQVSGNATLTIAPADLSGTVLKLGTGEEFFTVELRREVPDVLDGDLTTPFGVVVERVRLQNEPSPDRGDYFNTLQNCVNCEAFDTFLSIEQADGRFDLENRRGRDDADDLFLADDVIEPSIDEAPRTVDHQVFSTNRIDGTPTGIRIAVTAVSETEATIDIESADVADPCAEIARYCDDLECTVVDGHGECGKFTPPPPPPIPPVDDGCPCSSSGPQAPSVILLAFVLWRCRRRYRC